MTTPKTNTDRYPGGDALPVIDGRSAFAVGSEFPPERERGRIYQFDRFYRWSNHQYVGFLPQEDEALQLRFNVSGRQSSYRLAPNMFRFIMRFWGDAIAEPPVLDYEGSDRIGEFLKLLGPSLARASRLVVHDMIRYGVGVFWSRHPMIPESIDPRFWFPIRPAHDEHGEGGNVIAYPYTVKPDSANDHIFIASYDEEGNATGRLHKLDGLTISSQVGTTEVPSVEGAVVAIRTGEGFYGTSDYIDSAEYVAELVRREGSISAALDRHANPHLAVPEGSLQVDANGNVTIAQDGMVIPVPDGGAMPAYVTWEAHFDAQTEAISRAEQRILRFSQIAPILATPGEFQLRGGLPSGAALRRLAVISVNRLSSIRQSLDEAYRQVIPAQAALLGESGGEKLVLEPDKIGITWPPPFGTGTDEAEAIATLVNAGAMSKETALQLTERISRSEAEEQAQEQQQQAFAMEQPDDRQQSTRKVRAGRS